MRASATLVTQMPRLFRNRTASAAALATPPAAITASFAGSIGHSQIAIGEHIVQHNYGPGATVNTIAAADAPALVARARPVSQLPRDVDPLHEREADVRRARLAQASRTPIQFHGPSGLGKTALLRHLAHRPSEPFGDGVVYYRSRRESLDDLLVRIFEHFYEPAGTLNVKPTSAQLAQLLGDTDALLLLDDVDLDGTDLETLLQTLPRAAFVIGSHERTLWSDGASVRLRGLSGGAALRLVAAALGRPLGDAERRDVERLCELLDGHPLQLLKTAARIRDEGATTAQLVAELGAAASAPAQLTVGAAPELSLPAARVLSLLAALDGTPLHIEHVVAIAGVRDAAAVLAELEQRGLAQSHSPRYSATAPLDALADPVAGDRWGGVLLTHLVAHAERHVGDPDRLRDDLEPIVHALRWGVAHAAFADVVRLARASDATAELAGLWDAWGTILELALQAAELAGDLAGRAWALHQLGTRALCLGDDDDAASRLGEALDVRQQLGDAEGAAATRHNLDQLFGGGPFGGSPPDGPAAPGGPPGGAPTPTDAALPDGSPLRDVLALPTRLARPEDGALHLGSLVGSWLAPLGAAGLLAIVGVAVTPHLANTVEARQGDQALGFGGMQPLRRGPADRRLEAILRQRAGDPAARLDDGEDELYAIAGEALVDQPTSPPAGDPRSEGSSEVDDPPSPPPPPAPQPEPAPPPAPEMPATPLLAPDASAPCGPDLGTVLGEFVDREIVIGTRLLQLDPLIELVTAQVDSIELLIDGLANHCSGPHHEEDARP